MLLADPERKHALRLEALRRRDALSPEEIAERSHRIAERVMAMPEWREAEAVLGYYSFKSEVRTEELLQAALDQGKRLALPRVNTQRRELDLFYVPALGEPYLRPGTWGILEPVPQLCESAALEDIDLILVPGVAFDLSGGRIGYGGGFYDRLLKKLRPGQTAIALAFEVQIVDRVPLAWFDQKVPVIVTEERVIRAAPIASRPRVS